MECALVHTPDDLSRSDQLSHPFYSHSFVACHAIIIALVHTCQGLSLDWPNPSDSEGSGSLDCRCGDGRVSIRPGGVHVTIL